MNIYESYQASIAPKKDETIDEAAPKGRFGTIAADMDEDDLLETLADRLHKNAGKLLMPQYKEVDAVSKELKAAGYSPDKMMKELKKYLLDDKKMLVEEALKMYGFD